METSSFSRACSSTPRPEHHGFPSQNSGSVSTASSVVIRPASCKSPLRLPLTPSAHLARRVQLVPTGPFTLRTSVSLSAGHQALPATLLAPGDATTLGALRDPSRRPSEPYAPLDPNTLQRLPERHCSGPRHLQLGRPLALGLHRRYDMSFCSMTLWALNPPWCRRTPCSYRAASLGGGLSIRFRDV